MKLFGNFFNNSSGTQKADQKASSSSLSSYVGGIGKYSHRDFDDESKLVFIFIEENEAWLENTGWSHTNLNPQLGHPTRYRSGLEGTNEFPTPPLPADWHYIGQWEPLHSDEIIDDEGWHYAMTFEDMDNGIYSPCFREIQCMARRKQWKRAAKCQNASINRGSKKAGTGDNLDNDKLSEASSKSENEFEVESDTGSSHLNEKSHQSSSRKRLHEIKFSDPTVQAIAQQIKELEDLCDKKGNAYNKMWEKEQKPVLANQIKDFSSQIDDMKLKLERNIKKHNDSNKNKGKEDSSSIYDSTQELSDIQAVIDVIEDCKKKYFLPYSPIVVGSDGVYLGLDDVWLEYASGFFMLDLIPNPYPQANLILTSKDGSKDSGVSISLQLEGFNLVGEKGKRIPQLNFSSLKISLVVRITIGLFYDLESKKWKDLPEMFQIEMLSFKGPYLLSTNVVSTIISLVTPSIKTALLSSLPQELGLLLKSFVNPLVARGGFDICGPKLELLTTSFEKCDLISKLCDYSPSQVEMFHWMQRSMERASIIRTMTDLLQYRRKYARHQEHWATLMQLWNQVSRVYSGKYIERILESQSSSIEDPSSMSFLFNNILAVMEDIRRKRFSIYLNLSQLEMQINLNDTIVHCNAWMTRSTNEQLEKASGIQAVRLKALLETLKKGFEAGKEAMTIIKSTIDWAQVTLTLSLLGGRDGKLNISIKDILAQAPLILNISIDKELNIGHNSLVPFVACIDPTPDGKVSLDLYYYNKEPLTVQHPPNLVKSMERRMALLQKELDAEKSDESNAKSLAESNNSSPIKSSSDINKSSPSKSDFNTENSYNKNNLVVNMDQISTDMSSNQLNVKNSSTQSDSTSLSSIFGNIEGASDIPVSSSPTNSSTKYSIFNTNTAPSGQTVEVTNSGSSALEKMKTSLRRTSLALTASTSFFNTAGSTAARRLSLAGFTSSSSEISTLTPNLDGSSSDGPVLSVSGASVTADEGEGSIPCDGSASASQILKSIGLGDLALKYAPAKKTSTPSDVKKEALEAARKQKLDKEAKSKLIKSPSGSVLNKNSNSSINNLSLMKSLDCADTLLSLEVMSPHISMISDRKMTLKSGSELYTILLGPKDKTWKPFGANINEGYSEQQGKDTGIEESEVENVKGCPIFVQTSAGIKFLTKIPELAISLYPPAVFQFIDYHFEDKLKFKQFLDKFVGVHVVEEQLEATCQIIRKIANYFFIDNLSLSANLNGMIQVIDKDIVITATTPQSTDRSSRSSIAGSHRLSTRVLSETLPDKARTGSSFLHQPNRQLRDSFNTLNLYVEFNLLDLIEDITAIDDLIKVMFEVSS
jgi:hypothetical protein